MTMLDNTNDNKIGINADIMLLFGGNVNEILEAFIITSRGRFFFVKLFMQSYREDCHLY